MDSERGFLRELGIEPGTLMEMLLDHARELGFVETDELRGIRGRFLGSQDLGEQKKLSGDYQAVSQEQIIDLHKDPTDGPRYQIALDLVLAGIWDQVGNEEGFLSEIRVAYIHAHMHRYDDIKRRIESAFPDLDLWDESIF